MNDKNNLMPTLSAIGWTNNPNEQLDFALAHFLESERTQSYLFSDEVSDANSIVAHNNHDIDKLIHALKTSLTNYLGRIFDTADVTAMKVDRNPEDSILDIYIELRISSARKSSVAKKMARFKFNRLNNIINYHNDGVLPTHM